MTPARLDIADLTWRSCSISSSTFIHWKRYIRNGNITKRLITTRHYDIGAHTIIHCRLDLTNEICGSFGCFKFVLSVYSSFSHYCRGATDLFSRTALEAIPYHPVEAKDKTERKQDHLVFEVLKLSTVKKINRLLTCLTRSMSNSARRSFSHPKWA